MLMGVGVAFLIYKHIYVMTQTSLILILIAFAVLAFFIIRLEIIFAKDQSHLELVEMKPITNKNIEATLKEFGATDIFTTDDGDISFTYQDIPLWISANKE